MIFSRRRFFELAGADGVFLSRVPETLASPSTTPLTSGSIASADGPDGVSLSRSKVALAHGESWRKNISEALLSLDPQIQTALQRKRYVLIKPNNVSTEI